MARSHWCYPASSDTIHICNGLAGLFLVPHTTEVEEGEMVRAMEHDFIPGLAGVPVTRSAISDIDGHRGILKLRGYAIEELAEKSTYEEAAYLVLKGELPNAGQLERFEAELAACRAVEPEILDIMKLCPKAAHPMAALQTGG